MNRPLFLAAWLILAVPLIWDGALYFSGLYQGAFALLRGLLVALALEVGTAALVGVVSRLGWFLRALAGLALVVLAVANATAGFYHLAGGELDRAAKRLGLNQYLAEAREIGRESGEDGRLWLAHGQRANAAQIRLQKLTTDQTRLEAARELAQEGRARSLAEVGLLVTGRLGLQLAALVLAFLAANPGALNPQKTTAEPPSPTGPIRGPDGKFKAKQE